MKRMDYSQLDLTYVVTVYQDNEKVNDLEKLINVYSQYSEAVLSKVHFIFVNDCSPVPINIENTKINYTLVKVIDDIMWNQGGARNLGVHLAKTPKLILTDLDHTFPERVFKDLLAMKIPNEIYKFRRSYHGKKISSAPNLFFCSKATYYKSLGVDEAFCGKYGHEDIYFFDLQKYLGTRFKKYRKEMIISHENNHHSLVRDADDNLKLLEIRREAIKNKTPFAAHSRKFLSFEWEEVKSNWI
jgi:hypothetical protein